MALVHSLVMVAALVSSEEPQGPKKLLVLDFAGVAPAALRSEVSAQVRGGVKDAIKDTPWKLMPNENIRAMLMALGEDEKLCDQGRCGTEHLATFGADAGITGEVMVVAPTVYVTMNLHDVKIGARIDSVSVQAGSTGELYSLVRKAAATLVRKSLLRQSSAEPAPAPSTSSAPPGKKPGKQVLLVVNERGPDGKQFTTQKTLTQKLVVETLKEQGITPVTDTAWIPAPAEKGVREQGEAPILEADAYAVAKNLQSVMSVRVVLTLVEKSPEGGSKWIATARVRQWPAGNATGGTSREAQPLFECKTASLDECAQVYREKVLEPLLAEQPAAP